MRKCTMPERRRLRDAASDASPGVLPSRLYGQEIVFSQQLVDWLIPRPHCNQSVGGVPQRPARQECVGDVTRFASVRRAWQLGHTAPIRRRIKSRNVETIMRFAEEVTFGGAGFDRAAHLRGADRQPALRARNDARVLPVWRGKPLIAGERRDRLGWLRPGHASLSRSTEPGVFLGLVNGAPRFAADVSSWEPGQLDVAAMAAFFDPTEQRHPDLPDDHRFAELRGVMTRLSALDAELSVTARGLLNWHDSHRFCARCGHPSEINAAGWQRECGQCGAHHFPRSDPVVIMLVTAGNSLLVGRSHAWPAGMYSLLAGFMEPGETIEGAVRREVMEETGVRVGAVSYLASQPWPFPSSLMLGCHGEALSQEITLDTHELQDARWMSREAMAEAFFGRDGAVTPAREGAIAHFLIRNWLADRLT